jgi:hypothetical protein
MKTAMQELIDEMDIIKGQLWQEGLKDKSTMISDMIKKAVDKLEKEKEQIIDAAKSCNYIGGATDIEAEQYYDQTYNQKEETLEEWKSKFTHHCAIKNKQKQHIIDIMKADEDDGLYKMFDTDSDKKY